MKFQEPDSECSDSDNGSQMKTVYEVVPVDWLDLNEDNDYLCYWPVNAPEKAINNLVKQQATPDKDKWKLCPCELKKTYGESAFVSILEFRDGFFHLMFM